MTKAKSRLSLSETLAGDPGHTENLSWKSVPAGPKHKTHVPSPSSLIPGISHSPPLRTYFT